MRAPGTVAVIGGGTMGAGIAHVLAAADRRVTVVEADAAAAETARERISASLAGGAPNAGAGDIVRLIRVTTVIAEIPAHVDLVVEAVPESAGLKARVLAAAEQVVGPGTVLASNTSALSITGLGGALRDPTRFLGTHFFNPVPASALVEVVTGADTADPVRDRVVGWVDALGKTAVVVRDAPGFATSRLGVLLGLEAVRMLEEGVADAATIDTAMELGYRHPTGPLRLSDLVGLDVRLAIAESLSERPGERFAPPQLLRDKVARGELGRKSGQGFYRWDRPR